MKKLLSIIMSFVMLFSVFSIADVSALSAPENSYATAPLVRSGQTIRLYAFPDKHDINVFFLADEDGWYELTLSMLEECRAIRIYQGNEWCSFKRFNRGESIKLATQLSAGCSQMLIEVDADSRFVVDLTVTKGHTHSYKSTEFPAQIYDRDCYRNNGDSDDEDYVRIEKTEGGVYDYCEVCGDKVLLERYPFPEKVVVEGESEYTYNGKIQSPKVKAVYDENGELIAPSEYTVERFSIHRPEDEDYDANVGLYAIGVRFNGKKYVGTMSGMSYKIVPQPTAITGIKAKSCGFSLSWDKVKEQITQYEIVYSRTKDFKSPKSVRITDPKQTSATVSGLEPSTKYYVKIRTAQDWIYNYDEGGGYICSEYSEVRTVTTKPRKTEITSKASKSKGFRVSWKKCPSPTKGYQVKYSTSSSFKNAKYVTVNSASTTSKTVKGLKPNKKYYIKVRAYVINDGKRSYSDWSYYRTVKTGK